MNVRAHHAPRCSRKTQGQYGPQSPWPTHENSSTEEHGRCIGAATTADSYGVFPEHVKSANCRRRKVVCLFCVLYSVLTAGLCAAQEPFRLTPYAKFLFGMGSGHVLTYGDLLVPAGGRPHSGTRVDLGTDLGVDQTESTSLTFQATILDRHLIDIDYLMLQPTGYAKAPRTFRFQNRTYTEGTPVETRLDLNWFRVSYGYRLAAVSSWWIIPRLGAHHVRCAATINGETKEDGVMSNTRSLDCTFPVLGLETRYLFPYGWDLGLEFEGVYMLQRGYLTSARITGNWEIHPDVVLSLSAFHRIAESSEDNQPLNNYWSYHLLGVSGAIRFSF